MAADALGHLLADHVAPANEQVIAPLDRFSTPGADGEGSGVEFEAVSFANGSGFKNPANACERIERMQQVLAQRFRGFLVALVLQ